MKRLLTLKSILIAGVFLSLLFVNIGSLRCEPQRRTLSNIHSKANKETNLIEKDQDRDWQKDQSEKFKVLEWLIMQNLLKKYEKLDGDAELSELPD